MCGLAGYLGSREIPPDAAARCLERMRHRGPDSNGSYRHTFRPGQNLLLLHSRLSIIDLDERAGQPFRCERSLLAFNGEIYNYLELRHDLSSTGVTFRTQSDTEVLLRKLMASGLKALDQFEGMWAFAAYDEDLGTLLLSRDRFGEKPLYLYRDDSGLYFGSEVKFLSILAGQRFDINRRQILRFLVNGYKSLYKTRETFFEGVTEIEPGSCLMCSPGKAPQTTFYWEPKIDPDDSMRYSDAVDGARAALMNAVKLRLRSDVPLAFCMSGGVDSNALISIARKAWNYDVHGFTIVNRDERYDEHEMVEKAVSDLNIRHTAVPLESRDFLHQLRSLVRHHDAPVYTITYFAHWVLMQRIAEHGYRIAISGTGADEIFTGYYDHQSFYLNEVRKDPRHFDASLANWRRYIQPIVRNPALQDPLAFIRNPSERSHIYLHADRFRDYLAVDFQETFQEVHYCESLLRNRMLNEMFQEAVPVILHEDDLNAMSCSIENRSPFLDRKLFDFCGRIPSRHLIRDGFGKAVLRDAVRGIAPDCVVDNRRKVGFNAPIDSLLNVNDPDTRAALLDDGPIFEWVRRDKIERLMGKGRLPNSESKFVFNFITSKFFLEEFGA
jgi:asparagine synthase (glutamine-hydrolysing)